MTPKITLFWDATPCDFVGILEMSKWNILPLFPGKKKKKAVLSSETQANLYWNIGRHTPEVLFYWRYPNFTENQTAVWKKKPVYRHWNQKQRLWRTRSNRKKQCLRQCYIGTRALFTCLMSRNYTLWLTHNIYVLVQYGGRNARI